MTGDPATAGNENVRRRSTSLLRDVERKRDFCAAGSMISLGPGIALDRNDLSRWNVDAHEPWLDADRARPAFVFSVDTAANSPMGGGL